MGFCSVLLLSSARFEAEPSRRQGQHRRALSVPCLSHGRPELYLLRVVCRSEFVFRTLRREWEGCRLSVRTGRTACLSVQDFRQSVAAVP